METHGFVKKTWHTDYITEALNLSRDAWDEYVVHGKCSTPADTRKLFLIGPNFRKKGGTVLVESDEAGEKWGMTDFMADISIAEVHHHRQQWLERAASFGGSLYLIDLQLRDSEEEHSCWAALRGASSTSSPHTLFILFDSIGCSCRLHEFFPSPLQTISCPHVKKLALYGLHSSAYREEYGLINFSPSIPNKAIDLHTLHLEKVRMSREFSSALSEGRAFHVSHTLSLVDILPAYSPRHREAFPVSDLFDLEDSKQNMVTYLAPHKFLEWQLRELSLIGMFSESIDMFSFFEVLGRCTHTPLRSLSLRRGNAIQRHALAHHPNQSLLVGAVVDALHNSGLQFLDLDGLEQDPAIQAQLLRNRHSPTLQKREYSKVPAKSVRLFTCGDAYAGKTTLLSTLMSTERSGRLRIRDKLKATFRPRAITSERTRGIEIRTIERQKIRLSVWDMAGQAEFHAFHDHMFPDPSASHGSPAMFMFVWSPMDSKSEKRGQPKTQHEFESSFRYWLRFITSKTRQSNIRRKLIVVFTRQDQTKLVRDALRASIDTLSATFSDTIEMVDVLEVDARSEASVKPLGSSILQTAQDVLKGVEVYSICSEVNEHLSKAYSRMAVAGGKPIISWDEFTQLCRSQLSITELEVLKAIANSLNESGDIIYLSNVPFLVLDPNWFCNEVMGSLIRFPHPADTNRVILPIHGYAEQDYLEKLLMESSRSTVEGSVLLALMEAMHLCCKVQPGDPGGMVFIPATLPDASVIECLQWRGTIGGRKYVHVGRRLECDKKDCTFLTPGLFSTIQVAFNKAFSQRNDVRLGEADVQMGKGFMAICVQDSEILVEWGLAEGGHVIDVMMRAPDDEDAGCTLEYVEEKIIKTVVGVCAQPVGNQGVRLVEGVIRPDCLHTPSPPHVRADQCALTLDLKQELKEQLEGGRRHEKLLHFWKGNTHLQPVTSHLYDLLGAKEFMQVLMSYKESLVEASLMSATSTSHGQASHDIDAASTSSQQKNWEKDGHDTQAMAEWMTEESSQVQVDENERVVDALSNSMVKVIYRKLQSMDGKLVGLRQSVHSLHQDMRTKLDAMYEGIGHLRSHALPKVQKLVEQSLSFAVENEAGKIPRFVFLTTDDKNLLTTLLRGLKHVRIELFCEHRERPHRVDGQEGLRVSTVDDGTMIKQALPYANRFLKVLTLLAKVGAHVFAGAGSTIPDFSRIVALVADSPGILDNQGSLANMSTSPGEDFNGWRQWLVSVLEKNGGMNESNIASKFKLRRALYKDTSQVAWLCGMHYKDQCPLPLV